jgi:large repetitive protein
LTINAEAGSTVQVFDGANLLGQATEGANGVFTFTTASLSETAHAFTAKATDGAGNVSDASVVVNVTVDTTVATPTAQLSSDTGSSASDLVTSDASITFSTLAVDVTRTFAVDGGAASDSYVAPTSNGAHTVVVTDTDTAGNVATATVSFTLDTQADAPVVSLATNSGATSDNITNTSALTAPTSVEPGAKVEYSINGGDWSETYAAPTVDGAYSVAVRQTDVAGNISASTTVDFTLDTTGPTVSSLSPTDGGKSLGLAANLVVTASEALTKGTGTITLAKADGTVIETFDVANSDQITVNGNQLTIDPSKDLEKDQAYEVTATGKVVTDLAGNDFTDVGGNDGWQFTGAGASVTIDKVTGDDLVNKAEWAVANASTHTIVVTGTVTAEAAILEAFTKEDLSGTVTGPNGSGSTPIISEFTYSYTSGTSATWSVELPASMFMGEGSLGLFVSILGTTGPAAAVAGAATSSVAFDTVVQAPSVSLQADTGVSNTDGVTSNGSVSVTGKEAGAQIEYSIDGTNWTSTFTAAEGENSVQVRQTDAAGNISPASAALVFTLDATAPAAAAITTVDADTGKSAADRVTNDTTPVLTVTAESGAMVGLGHLVGGVPTPVNSTLYSVVPGVSSSGLTTYTITATSALADDVYAVVVVDTAGNQSVVDTTNFDTSKFKIDTTAPDAAIITTVDADTGKSAVDRVTNDPTPVLTVTAESGAMLGLGHLVDGVPNPVSSALYSVVEGASSSGVSTYTITATSALADDVYAVVVVDTAGIKSVVDTTQFDTSKFKVDTMAPAMPTILAVADRGGNSSDNLTNLAKPTLTIDAESGLALKIGKNGIDLNATQTVYSVSEGIGQSAGHSTYTVTFSADIGDGTYGLKAFDLAGNSSGTSTQQAIFTVDLTAPTLAIKEPAGIGFDFGFTFSEEVKGFSESDLVVANGKVTIGSLVGAEGSKEYTVEILPDSSTSPVEFKIDVPAAAAADLAGNATSNAGSFSHWVMIGTSANEVLTLSGGHNVFVDLKAGGNDTVKIADASELVSTTGARDVIEGFAQGDKIDLSAIFKSAGYSSITAGTIESPIVLKNAAILNNFDVYGIDDPTDPAFTLLNNVAKVDVYANTATYYKLPTDGIKLDFLVNDSVTDYWMDSGKFIVVPTYDEPITNLTGAVAGGSTSGSTVAAGGKIGTVYFQLADGATSFTFALESLELNAGPEAKLPSAVSTDPNAKSLSIVVDGSSLTAATDNQLHISAIYSEMGGVTHVTMQYDTNSTVGATSLSDILHLEFDGNITASLTPQSIIPL